MQDLEELLQVRGDSHLIRGATAVLEEFSRENGQMMLDPRRARAPQSTGMSLPSARMIAGLGPSALTFEAALWYWFCTMMDKLLSELDPKSGVPDPSLGGGRLAHYHILAAALDDAVDPFATGDERSNLMRFGDRAVAMRASASSSSSASDKPFTTRYVVNWPGGDAPIPTGMLTDLSNVLTRFVR